LIVAWIVLWILFRDHTPSRLATSELAPSHQWLNDLRDRVNASRADNLLFTVVFDPLRAAVDRLAVGLQSLISQPALDRPVPIIGWFGVLALVMLLGHAVSGWRMATLCGAGFACFGLLGLWQESMDTLAMTLAAVLICIVIGIPIGVLCARSRRIERCVTPVCDFLQTMPTFVYLAPLTLIFLIGPASAVIATLLYALPPVIRITAHGMAGVPVTVAEAGTSLGATDWQLLRKVQLPMAARMIVTGINQTTMCALSMVTIAALIDAPGLGRTVMQALVTLDVGAAFTGGLAIVILAVVLDRLTTAAGVRVDTRRRQRTRAARRTRHRLLGCLGLLTTGAVYLSYTFVWAAVFPGQERHGLLGRHVIAWVNTANEWVKNHLSEATDGIKDLMTYGALNPLESVIADSPWYLTGTVVLLLAWIVAGVRAGVIAGCCLGLLQATGLWYEAMVTLTSTLVATSMVMLCGLVLGVWMGRSDRADLLLRPLLDAAQVMPAFVYLVPCLGLFGATRFTAIVAAVVFAAPVSIKLIAEGMRGVCPAAVEAAVSAGATPLQVIAKVQLPLASRSLALAANQGLIYVLSMVVVGGLVGAGALGYLVVAGFSQTSLYGKGLAAGLAIVLLGILLDRTTQAAARRVAATDGRPN
ncbi:MAG: ABC transporter permease subunit, partial [Micromonosporaceae bacterium]|nr:ABC transporter permease subunit [Micromonosporaceae bacterium]